MNIKWHKRYIELAHHVSTWSRDPSTQVGAVIVDPATGIVRGMGYNGFPRGIKDTEERLNDRDLKLALTVHGELNAILNANGSVRGCNLYLWPFMSCDRCAVHVVNAGIEKVFAPQDWSERAMRWLPSFERTAMIYLEGGVQAKILSPTGFLHDFSTDVRILRDLSNKEEARRNPSDSASSAA